MEAPTLTWPAPVLQQPGAMCSQGRTAFTGQEGAGLGTRRLRRGRRRRSLRGLGGAPRRGGRGDRSGACGTAGWRHPDPRSADLPGTARPRPVPPAAWWRCCPGRQAGRGQTRSAWTCCPAREPRLVVSGREIPGSAFPPSHSVPAWVPRL